MSSASDPLLQRAARWVWPTLRSAIGFLVSALIAELCYQTVIHNLREVGPDVDDALPALEIAAEEWQGLLRPAAVGPLSAPASEPEPLRLSRPAQRLWREQRLEVGTRRLRLLRLAPELTWRIQSARQIECWEEEDHTPRVYALEQLQPVLDHLPPLQGVREMYAVGLASCISAGDSTAAGSTAADGGLLAQEDDLARRRAEELAREVRRWTRRRGHDVSVRPMNLGLYRGACSELDWRNRSQRGFLLVAVEGAPGAEIAVRERLGRIDELAQYSRLASP